MTIFNVSSASELKDALSKANAGDEIRLAGGDYGELKLGSSAQFSSEVTITSVDPNNPASFSLLRMQDSSNITFDSVVFDYTYTAGDNTAYNLAMVNDSNNITFTNVVFDGDFATSGSGAGAGSGRGLRVTDSQDINIINSEFHTFWKGVSIVSSFDVNFIGNDIHTIRSDGMNISGSTNVLVEKNYFHDFLIAPASDDHRDMIQLMRSSGDGSTNVTIRNNVFDMGSGDDTQTIWAGGDNANPSNLDHWHKNIVVEGNMIYNAHTHGIAFFLTDGIEVTNNTLIAVPREQTGGVAIPKINIGSESKNVTIEKNVTSTVTGFEGQSDWTVNDNVEVRPEDYDDVFIIYATSANDGYNQFGVKPGSIIDQLNAGSPLADLYPMSYEAGFSNDSPSVDQDENDDAGDPSFGDAPDEDATNGGVDDGATNGGTGGDTVRDAAAFLDVFDDFVLDISTGLNSDQVSKVEGDARVAFDGSDYAIVFDGEGGSVNLGRLTEFEQSEQIAFTIEFARNEADGSEQRLVWNHKKLGLSLKEDGLIVKVGAESFRVDDLGLNDVDTHRISVLLDQDSDRLQVLVDDKLVFDETETDLDFVGGGGHEWGWKIGTPWSRYVDGVVTDFRIDDDVAFIDDAVLVLGDPLLA